MTERTSVTAAPAIKSKLPKAGTTIFTIMSALANETGAINLSQGFPDFNVSPRLIELYHKAMLDGYNQYAPMPGLLPLRERIAAKMHDRFGSVYNPESEVTITAGGTQAIFTAIMATVNAGDEVLLFEPAYDSYVPAIELAGGIPVPVAMNPPDFKINWDDVKKRVNNRTRMIMINTPHNPTGSVLSSRDLTELENLVSGTDIIVLSDEVYEHILFDGLKHCSVASIPSLAARSFIVYSFGKTFHATGWKTGYCIAPAVMMKEFRKVHQFNVFSVNTPLQHALSEYMKDKDNYSGLESYYQEKRDLFLSLIKGGRFKPLPCHGSYFQLLDYSALSEEKDTEYAVRLTRDHGVASIPISVFYTHPPEARLLRFCFAKKEETLKKAAERLMML